MNYLSNKSDMKSPCFSSAHLLKLFCKFLQNSEGRYTKKSYQWKSIKNHRHDYSKIASQLTRISWRELWGKNINPFQSAYQGDFFNTLLYWLILTRRHNSLVTFSILRSLYSGCSPTPANLFALVSVPNYWLMQPEVLLQCNLINIVGSTMWSTLATHLPSLWLNGLFPLSDLWYSSQPRHIGSLRLNSANYLCSLVEHITHQNSVGD